MAFFTKTDPAVKQQRELENKLQAKRSTRDDLLKRRQTAEASAAAHREKARKLASEGAADTALLAVEEAMRREQDRAATLIDAIGDADATIADLDSELAQVIDQRCRAETAAAVNALIDKWGPASTAFNSAVGRLAELARESALIVGDAHPLKVFLEAVQQQVQPEADLIANVLRGHVTGVLAGDLPASLPKPPEPVQPEVIERPPIQRMFTLRIVRWLDAFGVQQLADQYTDADLTPSAANNGLRCGAVVALDDPRRRNLRGAHGGRHPNVHQALDLDDEAACQRPAQINSGAVGVLSDANITVLDRGPPIQGTISMERI